LKSEGLLVIRARMAASGSGRLAMTDAQKIVLTSVLSTMFVPVMFLAPSFCTEATGNWQSSLGAWLPSALAAPVATAFPIIGFALPCGLFAWLLSRIWIKN
jgi:hypothetical protein